MEEGLESSSSSSSSSICGHCVVKGDGHLEVAGEMCLDSAAIVSPYGGYGKKQFIELPKSG